MTIPGGTETILLVEDESSVQTVVGRLLRKLGYTVLIADDGLEGASLFAQCSEEIDLVITDIVMPGQTGIEMAQELRSRRPGLKILFLSGYAGHDPDSLESPLPQPFLPKPFSVEALAESVRGILDG
jgi:two-component system cell cycle sensor histidine kinase/response regulator CckA